MSPPGEAEHARQRTGTGRVTGAPAETDDPVLLGDLDDAALTDRILGPIWSTPRPRLWWLFFGLAGAGSVALLLLFLYTTAAGIGVWGNNVPVAWAFAIVNFVWWIGLGHAGTFISAFLLLLEQRWRGSINRLAEIMTLFAVAIAGLFPVLHLGRPWFFYWLAPYPSTMEVWPQFRSALPWDAAAIFTYGTVSLLFWYLGLVPDLATARDRAPTLWKARIYGLLSLGWRGSARDWHRYRIVYGLLAGLATPLVISVHSIVSLDFAMAQVPGWHSTIFPPYFVVGAIFSGFALVLILLLPVRRHFRLEEVITPRHLDAMAKILLTTGWILIYAYVVEHFVAWYSGDVFERHQMLLTRPTGPYAWMYWGMTVANCLAPQIFWSRRMRRSPRALFGASVVILVGMWLERFVIVVTSLHRDFLPSSWAMYAPTWVDLGLLAGSVALFGLLFLLFLRFVPAVPIHEVKELRHELIEEAG